MARAIFFTAIFSTWLVTLAGCSNSNPGTDCSDPSACDDGDSCTEDTCDPVTGCHHATVSCDDNDVCTTDTCDSATGCVNAAITCDDGDACTTDNCDPVTGCANAPLSCDDNDVCTTDTCDSATGCVNAAIVCDDGDACTTDNCDPVTGCANATLSCDDNDACTTDTCDSATGCVNAAITCDDGDACTANNCDPVTGCAYPPLSCDDNDACTTDTCDSATGCVNAAITCDDADACTANSCDPMTGCAYPPLSCDDNNACTTDTCDSATGCVNAAITCDDGDACTANSCDPMTGCANPPLSCDDNDVCTTDSCDSATGCANAAINCDDGDACTLNTCDPVTGCAYPPNTCDDGDPCTDAICVPGSGCLVVAISCVDLRADVNRDGVVDLTDPTDDLDEDTWDTSHGAIFLANIDDDQDACPSNGTDVSLAACHDAADTVINGSTDLYDLARLRIPPWAAAPADAVATVQVNAAAAPFVRLFKDDGTGTFVHYVPGNPISAAELQAGVELGIEALDFVRDDTIWDGFVDVTLAYDTGTGPSGAYPDGADTVRLRVAPVVFHHALEGVQQAYASAFSTTGSSAYRIDLSAACTTAGVSNPLWELWGIGDPWTGDFFKTAYMTMPAPGGEHVIHVNFRSANYTSSLRSSGRVVFTTFRGPDVAGAVQYNPAHPDTMDTLNSFGNLMVIPPHGTWGLGRILRGSAPTFYPDQSFGLMLQAQGADPANSQGLQDIVTIDTDGFAVGHVNETVNFIQHPSGTHGWLLLVADPTLGWNELVGLQASGYGSTPMFQGTASQTTIDAVLADAALLAANQLAAVEIDNQRNTLKAATGITDADIISLPALFRYSAGYLLAHVPSMVSGLVLSDTHYAAPEPYGPVVSGQDHFKTLGLQIFGALGVTVHWVETWDLYHSNDGGLSSGCNNSRQLPSGPPWWSVP